MRADARPVERVERDDGGDPSWAGGLPCVRDLLTDGLDLGVLTVLVGENGSGKSTLVEAIAMTFGLSGEGGSTAHRHSSRSVWRGSCV